MYSYILFFLPFFIILYMLWFYAVVFIIYYLVVSIRLGFITVLQLQLKLIILVPTLSFHPSIYPSI